MRRGGERFTIHQSEEDIKNLFTAVICLHFIKTWHGTEVSHRRQFTYLSHREDAYVPVVLDLLKLSGVRIVLANLKLPITILYEQLLSLRLGPFESACSASAHRRSLIQTGNSIEFYFRLVEVARCPAVLILQISKPEVVVNFPTI